MTATTQHGTPVLLKISDDAQLLLNDAGTRLVVVRPDGSLISEEPLSLAVEDSADAAARWIASLLFYRDRPVPSDDALTQFAEHVHASANLWPDPYTDADLHSYGETLQQATEVDGRTAEQPSETLRDQMSSGGLRFKDFRGLLAAGLPVPNFLLGEQYPLLLEQQVHWLSGAPGCGKSTVALWLAKLYMEQGGYVVWVDWEAGLVPTLRRARDVGIADELLVERFMLADWKDLVVRGSEANPDAAHKSFREMKTAIDALGTDRALVVLDSASKALGSSGLDENKAMDVTAFTTNLVMPMRDDTGLSVIVIDHITKDAANTNYARGSGAKLADTDVHWHVERDRKFSRKQAGGVTLHQAKDRNGTLPFGATLSVGDGEGGLPVTLHGVAWEETDSADAQHVRDAITQEVKESGAAGLSLRNLVDVVKKAHGVGSKPTVTKHAKELAEDPTSAVQVVKATKRGQPDRYYWDESTAISDEIVAGLLSPEGTPGV